MSLQCLENMRHEILEESILCILFYFSYYCGLIIMTIKNLTVEKRSLGNSVVPQGTIARTYCGGLVKDQYIAMKNSTNSDANVASFAARVAALKSVKEETDIKTILAKYGENAALQTGLTIANVVVNHYDNGIDTFTFVVHESVLCDVGKADPITGEVVMSVNSGHNVIISAYALAGALKRENNEARIFANFVVDNPDKASLLFIGGKIDLLSIFVPQGEEYVNPYSSSQKPATFERDKVIHHVSNVKLGEFGKQKFNAMLLDF